ncbi:hypothetical protein EVAR_20378_1 [Eumeta japonica]|uniref:Uncharacterized protein n=1 Tax=Eumeta variegata TaxID=151549 RepID=A0A4C1ZSF7_EUMVA|nr:hypothetical protein EVAR_20378_1 [Eumeta japonica]
MPRKELSFLGRLLLQSGCEFCAAMKLRMKICTGWLHNEQLLNKTVQESSVERSQRLASQNFRTLANRQRESSADRSQRLASQNARTLLTAIGNPVLNVLNVWPHRIPELWLTVIGNQALNDPND